MSNASMSNPSGSNEERLSRYLRKVTGDLRTANKRIQQLEEQAGEPIAIVGMSCRYPGGVDTPDGLWDLVAAGTDAIGPFPTDRGWDLERLFDADPDVPGTVYAREGGFLDAAGDFDAGFFGLGPRTAEAMDPQQRLFLEASWEALENAGIDPVSLRDSDTGVYAGVIHFDYGRRVGAPGHSAESEGNAHPGVSASILSGRVSFSLGFKGPALSVDTACSSSLVALHLACQALRQGETSLALVGGVTVMSDPAQLISFARQRALSPDGRCRAFGAGADGTGFSDGLGMLVVERLSDARRNGHPILAVVRGTAVNQDGTSSRLTAPNGPAQEKVIAQALANAGLTPADIDAVEAHGTGTQLGDPIEARALIATYGRDRVGEPLRIGSLKSNIGHTSAAAGVGGVIKMVQAMRHETLPATLHADTPTPHVDWSAGTVRLLTAAEPWPAGERVRRAGVSSFGASGTNTHVILEEAPAPVETAAAPANGTGADAAAATATVAADDTAVVTELAALPLSSKTEEGVRAQAAKLLAWVRERPHLAVGDIAYSLVTGRTQMEWRGTVVAGDRDAMLAGLTALAEHGTEPSEHGPVSEVVTGRAVTRKTAFLCTGQGAQRAGMGRELYEAFPVFAAALDELCAQFDPLLGTSLRQLMFTGRAAGDGPEDSEALHRTEFTQPALFAYEVALYRLLESFGVTPDALIGHSIGELAAAHLAGVWSLPDACRLVAARGRLMGQLPAGGAMLAIAASEDAVAALLADAALSIAAVNSPTAVVVSGDADAVTALAQRCAERGWQTSRLRVSHAFHSHLMDPMLAEFATVAGSLTYHRPNVPLVSTLSGQLAGDEVLDPGYWVRQVREAVRFARGVDTLVAAGMRRFLEIGPDAVLTAMTRQCLPEPIEAQAAVLAGARRGRAEVEQFVTCLAQAHAVGVEVEWTALYTGRPVARVPLPTYAFQRRRYWVDPVGGNAGVEAAGLGAVQHPLLGAVLSAPESGEVLLTGRLSVAAQPWLADHVIGGAALFPGTGFAELVLRAGVEVGCPVLEELTLQAPLLLPATGGVQIQVVVGAPEPEQRPVAVYSRSENDDDDAWVLHARGTLTVADGAVEAATEAWPPSGATEIEVTAAYSNLFARGYEYGPAFQGVRALWRRGDEVFAEIAADADTGVRAEGFGIHPALLDAALHAGYLAGASEDSAGQPESLFTVPPGQVALPFAWDAVELHAAEAAVLRVRLTPAGSSVSVLVTDEYGQPVLSGSVAARPMPLEQLVATASGGVNDPILELVWSPDRSSGTDDTTQLPPPEVGGWDELHEMAELPPVVLVEAGTGWNDTGDTGVVTATHDEIARILTVLQEALTQERFAASTLLIATRGAVALPGEEPTDLPGAAVWGLVRAAQAEEPGRIILVDTDSRVDAQLAAAVVAVGEPQVVVRGGITHTARLVRPAPEHTDGGEAGFGTGTVLITGGTGGLGAVLARHVVAEHGVRSLLLVSRSGPEAAGAAALRAELEQLGAHVTVAACDVADAAAVTDLIAAVPAERPLTGVIHAAGVLDDGTIASLTPQRMNTVLAPKADAAWYLHEATADLNLAAFVMFSSVSGTLGGPGQGNYAAANTFLDALAAQRRARGLAGQSLAWGPWARSRGMTAHLQASDVARLSRGGFAALTDERALTGWAAALRRNAPHTVIATLDTTALRDSAETGLLPAVLRELAPAARRRAVTAAPVSGLRQRLSSLDLERQRQLVFETLRTQIAAVRGTDGGSALEPGRTFQDLGFDSLSAVELRNRLKTATGLSLPAAVIFDYPTPQALAEHLADKLTGVADDTAVTAKVVADEPIAIVGMACRYPGGVTSPEELWTLVFDGVDATSRFPGNRGWDTERIYDPTGERPGTTYTREGGFLHTAGEFDPAFFGISPNEAATMDPQQFLLLETAWEALERAGIDPAVLRGSATGVFAGMMYHDYPANANSGSIASGRVSYVLGLEGPSVTVDTACSSSLVAMHLAGQSLRSGESDLALAGGVAVMATPEVFVEFSRQKGLAPDGRSKSFADAADGVAWSEGAGVLVLERLSDARRNGHEVLAVITGSAVNQDGASNGLTAPNGPSQRRVIRQALANARVAPGEVDVVEAHGTGTTLGDPIEAQALLDTYGQERAADRPLWLGSLKSNIGHAQAAAGVGGVIKMVMAMRHGLLPRTLHVDRPSTKVDWSAGQVELLTEPVAWPRTDRPRRAGVSSFGISGTNAHVVIEEAAAEPVRTPGGDADLPALADAPAGRVLPWVVSARSDAALAEQAARLVAAVTEQELDPADAGFSLASTRGVFEHRAVVLGDNRSALLSGTRALAAGAPSPDVVSGRVVPGSTGLVFSGQGAQWAGMASELRSAYPVFATHFDAIVAELDPLLGQPDALSVALASEELVDRTVYAQAGLFAFEVALYRLLESWGVRADVVAGHSIGEVAAAHVSGVLSLADACVLVAARGRLMQALPGGGAMVAVGAAQADVTPLLTAGVAIAAVNGPSAVVLSGVEDEVLGVIETCAERGWRTHRLRVSHAFHSALMEPMLAEFAAAISGLTFAEPLIPLVSTVTGALVTDEMTDPRYWVDQVRDTVRFADAVATMADSGVSRFAEVGPDAVLTPMVGQITTGAVALVRRNRADAATLLTGVAGLFVSGAAVDWAGCYAGTAARRIDLPTYAFQRERYWLDARKLLAQSWMGAELGGVTDAGLDTVQHPLLGAVVPHPDSGQVSFTGRWSLDSVEWLADHSVHGTVLLPGTGFVELAAHVGGLLGCDVVEELVLHTPLTLPATGSVAVQVVVADADDTGRRRLRVHSRADADGPWLLHAEGSLAVDPESPDAAADFDLATWPPAGAQPLDVDGAYDDLLALGYGYGPFFQGLRAAWQRGDELFAEVALPDPRDADGFGIHPALFDAALHAGILHGRKAGEAVLPFAWNRVVVHSAGAATVRVRSVPVGDDFAVRIADEQGRPVVSVGALVSRPVPVERLTADRVPDALFTVEWVAAPVSSEQVEPDRIAMLDSGRDLTALLTELDAAEDSVVPDLVLLECPRHDGSPADAARQVLGGVLDTVQRWLAEPRFAASRLVIVTEQAVAVSDSDTIALDQAPVWGLLRAAQAENPGRFQLLDVERDGGSIAADVLAAIAGEPEAALRGATVLVPRLTRPTPGTTAEPNRPIEPGTVLVTGGTGGLGAVIARHLVTEHGVRQLLLTSRRGLDAPGAAALRAELAELGAEVTVAACDVSDRSALTAVLAGIPDEHPLVGVVHAAGVADNGLIASMSADRIDAVFRPKAEAAWHLHELTRDRSLSLFVLLSSAGGLVLAAGQANYAAANVFLDALAAHRHTLGLPATALDYGMWERSSGLGAELSEDDFDRMRRLGFPPLSESDGLALFDAAVAAGHPQTVALRIDPAVLRTRGEQIPALVRGLVPAPARRVNRTPAGQALLQKLAGLPDADRATALVDFVRTVAAGILGHATADAVAPQQAFQQLGFDSLSAIEFRNKLNTATGLQLPATLIFDYPTPQAVAEFLGTQLTGTAAVAERAVRRVRADDEPIAVVAMACRYPGGVASPEDLWRLVVEGGDTVGAMPVDRGWDLEGIYDPEPGKAGKTYTRSGGFLYSAAEFDADFFGISPNEATMMDPQQRLLLEVSWEAVERAGLDPAALRGSSTGVFTGLMYHDYAQATGTGSGAAGSLVSGRVSYVFGLEGPSVTVDTACSSSLVALHLAGQSLRSGECDLALAGGAAVMGTPDMFLEFGRQRGLSPDGRCKSFSDTADGVGWAEGVGVLVLERLSDARRNGHDILAVIAGSAVNQDGASNGLAAPNGPSQRRVIRQALANAGLAPVDVDAVEAHGTGTTLGDPIEAQALLATYGQERAADRPLWLGSLKSNIGHAQAAAGVGGVIKMVMAMRHGLLPRTLHADQPSTKVDWTEGNVRLLTEAVPWPEAGRARRAGVSSFGISGTNAHVIIEQAPAAAAEPVATPVLPAGGLLPWVLSARSGAALAGQAARLSAQLDDPESPVAAHDPIDIGFSLASTRSVFTHRAVILAEGRAELTAAVHALAASADATAAGTTAPGVVAGHAMTGSTALVFSGQGAQWAGMATELRKAYPVFADHFDAIVAELDPLLAQPASLDAALTSEDLVDRTVFAQAGLFAFEVALFRLLESWGLRADVVAGHSIGEVAAAHVAGVLSLTDTCVLVAARGRLMQALPAAGAMVAIGAAETAVLPLLSGEVSVAAVNGPSSVVIAGADDAVQAVADSCVEKGWRTTRLRVSHAFHSALMEPMLAEFAMAIEGLTFERPSIALVSTVTGARIGDEMCDPSYWTGQVRDTVRFADAVATMADSGVSRFAEIGPDAVLTPMITQTLDSAHPAATVVPLARRGKADAASVSSGAARLFVSGADLDWVALYSGTGARRIPLPTYAFQRQRYWVPEGSTGKGDARSLGLTTTGHPLVPTVIAQPDTGGVILTGRLSLRTQPWLADHAVLGTVLFPGAGLVELALRAGNRVNLSTLADFVLHAPLVLPETGGVAVRSVVGAQDETGRRPVRIYSAPEAESDSATSWTLHAEGALTADPEARHQFADLTAWPPIGAQPLPISDVYSGLRSGGYEYGPAFQGLRAAWRRGDEVFAEVALPDPREAAAYGLHPALLDSALHALLIGDSGPDGSGPALPFEWSGVTVHAPGAAALRVRATRTGDRAVRVELADPTGAPVATVQRLAARPIDATQLAALTSTVDNALYHVEWSPMSLSDKEIRAVSWTDLGIEVPAALGDEVPAAVVLDVPAGNDPDAVRAATHAVLHVLRSWIADPRSGRAALVIRTSGAVSIAGEDISNLAGAAVGGLVRSAQAESAGRIILVDSDSDVAGRLGGILASGEPQVAVRSGRVHSARLVRSATTVSATTASGLGSVFGPDETVLITGASGFLGGLFARHLVRTRGVRHLLLLSRRGESAPGAAELAAELRDAGAEIDFVACDVADRAALAEVLSGIPASRPLTGVFHTAGVLDDGAITALTPERMDTVLRPKVDAALHLHELTAELPLKAFVLFSSVAGTLGSPGQGNYAAANACLDAVAAHRRASGRSGQSLIWGLWSGDGGMGEGLGDVERQRMTRSGLLPLSAEQGLALFDAAGGIGTAAPVLARLDREGLRGAGFATALLSGLVPARPVSAAPAALHARLAETPESERLGVLVDLVRDQVATVLGHQNAKAIAADRAFNELGFDSITAIEFRNALKAATGLPLPATLVFDYPSPGVLAEYLAGEFTFENHPEAPAEASEDEIRDALQTISLSRLREAGLLDALMQLVQERPGETTAHIETTAPSADESIDELDLDDLINLAYNSED
ncbi:SDR family NAD(P)-dependent oxidoreductase [Nocardia yamanashiensis]|uniref:type I polyketide synthase n=1 Tax=Nocardia yamanashiensis TaxID=209247 RepID=UPI001E390486|nr:type I polyketide synthase [Nocardia yamanashiensis]UGT45357.1 SDR family NAD(P)-dependent oxidoreductase [Nocardia yamanashiensis]